MPSTGTLKIKLTSSKEPQFIKFSTADFVVDKYGVLGNKVKANLSSIRSLLALKLRLPLPLEGIGGNETSPSNFRFSRSTENSEGRISKSSADRLKFSIDLKSLKLSSLSK